jgi:hypothetical protein
MWGKRKYSEKKSKEDYPESSGRPRDDFLPIDVNLRWVVL